MDSLHVWRIEEGGAVHWVIANDQPDALEVLRTKSDGMGGSMGAFNIERVDRLDDAASLEIHNDDRGRSTTRTCAQWVERDGRGYLCGTDW